MTVEKYKSKWEQDQQTAEQWWALRRSNQACPRNVLMQENRFKLFHRWHLTPQRSKHMYPMMDGKCWRRNGERWLDAHVVDLYKAITLLE